MSNIKRIGVYAGSFNPVHVGHADILHQSQEVFDEVIIAVGRNTEKVNKRLDPMPCGHPVLKGANILEYHGLLSDFLGKLDINDAENNQYFLIRGLRNGADLQYEQNQIRFIKEMFPSLRTVVFIGNSKFDHISSTSLRALREIAPKEYEKYVFLPVPKREGAKFGWDSSDL